MLVVSLLLLTMWFGALVLEAPMGRSVHLLGIAAILLVLLHKPRVRAPGLRFPKA